MSEQYTGEIKKVFTKAGRWSLLMEDDNWYGLGYKEPKGVTDGSQARFQFEMNGQYRNIVEGSLEAKAGTATSKAKSGGSSYAQKEQYWADKETRDIETQKKICMAGSLNTATAIVTASLAADVLKTTNKTKIDLVQATIVEIAEDIYRKIQNTPAQHDELMGNQAVLDDEPFADTQAPQAGNGADEGWEQK